jgi:four helix bundle protein
VASYRDLIAWQKGVELAVEIYRLSRSFPKEEQFGLTGQLRRASVSIPSNIAEGHGRRSRLDFGRFLKIALGSTREVETQIILAGRLELADRESLKQALLDAEELARVIQGLIRSQREAS